MTGNRQPETPTGRNAASIISVGDGEISVAALTITGGFLVLAENYYPGWRAWIAASRACRLASAQ